VPDTTTAPVLLFTLLRTVATIWLCGPLLGKVGFTVGLTPDTLIVPETHRYDTDPFKSQGFKYYVQHYSLLTNVSSITKLPLISFKYHNTAI
jgi:hypothetical protein